MAYISYPIESNPQLLLAAAYAYIQDRSPAWAPHDANLDTWILQAVASQASDLRELATDVPDAIFRYFGATILGIPPQDATTAIVTSTWTAIDVLGHLIPGGTLVGIRDNAGVLRGFRTLNDISIIPGLSMTDEGEVTLIADEAGLASDGIGGEDIEAEIIDPLEFVNTVILNGLTAGGADAEGLDDYTTRLSEYMRGLSTRPITAEDWSRFIINYPGVYRGLALDGYNPADDTYFNDKYVTLVGLDQFGLDLPTLVKQDLDDYAQSQREVNFIVEVIDASRTVIDVQFEAKCISRFSTTLVESDAIANVTAYLSPATWGIDPSIITSGAATSWIETQFVRYNNVLQVIENTQGIDYVSSLTINRSGDPIGTVDLPLDLPAALAVAGVVDGTVTL